MQERSDEGKLGISSPLSPLKVVAGVTSESYWDIGLDIALIVKISYVEFWVLVKWNLCKFYLKWFAQYISLHLSQSIDWAISSADFDLRIWIILHLIDSLIPLSIVSTEGTFCFQFNDSSQSTRMEKSKDMSSHVTSVPKSRNSL